VRYAYCQEYLLPSLLYAADQLGDESALGLADAQLALIAQEAAFSGDGSFYGKRLAALEGRSPYYYTRLESDRACALGQWVVYRSLIRRGGFARIDMAFDAEAIGAIEGASTSPARNPPLPSGLWHEPEHGAVMHRSPTRLVSFAWRAFGLAQGMCLPPDDGHLVEWESNLVGVVEFAADPHPAHPKPPPGRRLIGYRSDTFDGGFVTCGTLIEGAEVELAEGWTGRDLATHHIAFAALPDGRTVVGLELVQLGKARALVRSVKGLHLNIPNDFYNGFVRTLATEVGPRALASPAAHDDMIGLDSRWACVDGRLGVVGLYGAETLVISRSAARRGGAYRSLYVDELCWPCRAESQWADAGETLLDVGWAVLSGADAAATHVLATDARTRPLELGQPLTRGVAVVGADHQIYRVVANFGPEAAHIPITALAEHSEAIVDIATGERGAPEGLLLAAGAARVTLESRL